VVRVKDGDTIIVERDGDRIQVTIFGVECPGRRKPYGADAKRFTRKLLDDKTVRVNPVVEERRSVLAKVTVRKTEIVEIYRGRHRSERRVKVPVSVAEELLKAGMAKVSSDAGVDKRLLWLQSRAKAAKRGLWAGSSD
jgi:endonuclease YncB( thermonuclease family)